MAAENARLEAQEARREAAEERRIFEESRRTYELERKAAEAADALRRADDEMRYAEATAATAREAEAKRHADVVAADAQRRLEEERRTSEQAQRLVDEERRVAEDARRRVEEERRIAEDARKRADESATRRRRGPAARSSSKHSAASTTNAALPTKPANAPTTWRSSPKRRASIFTTSSHGSSVNESRPSKPKRAKLQMPSVSVWKTRPRRKFGYALNVPTAAADTSNPAASPVASPVAGAARIAPLGALLGSFESASRESTEAEPVHGTWQSPLNAVADPFVPVLEMHAPAADAAARPSISAMRRADAIAPFEPTAPVVPNFTGTRPDARALVPSEGSFGARADFADLLAEVVTQGVTGRVDFTAGTRQKSIVFESGRPVDAYSSQIFDRMEEYLLREGRITRAQYQEVRVKGLRSPRLIGSYLTAEGHLKPDELFSAVRGHLEDLIYSLFEWEQGTYIYVAEHALDDDRVMLDKDPRALVVEGIRRKYLLPRLIEKVGSPSTLLTRTDPEGRIDAELLGLTLEEKQVARLVDGSRNVDDIVFSSGFGALRVYQVLAGLLATGAVAITVRGIEGVNATGATDLDDIDRRRIQERVELARHADYFQVLGVARSATAYEVDLAFDRIARELAPGRLSPSIRDGMRPELSEIERVLEDARDVLRDPRTRDAYARHLPSS